MFAVYGEGGVTDKMCQKWLAKFHDGDFLLDGAPQLDRPDEGDSDQIKTLIENDQHSTTQDIANCGEQNQKQMTLVWSRQHKVYKTNWSHSCQPQWLPASHDTLAQEEKYLSHARHIQQRDTPRISAHVIRQPVYRAGPPIGRLQGKFPTWQQGRQDTYQETQRGGVPHPQGHN